jgi:hypothetical protein
VKQQIEEMYIGVERFTWEISLSNPYIEEASSEIIDVSFVNA